MTECSSLFFFSVCFSLFPGFRAQGRQPRQARSKYTRVPRSQPVRHGVCDVWVTSLYNPLYASISVCERVLGFASMSAESRPYGRRVLAVWPLDSRRVAWPHFTR